MVEMKDPYVFVGMVISIALLFLYIIFIEPLREKWKNRKK